MYSDSAEDYYFRTYYPSYAATYAEDEPEEEPEDEWTRGDFEYDALRDEQYE